MYLSLPGWMRESLTVSSGGCGQTLKMKQVAAINLQVLLEVGTAERNL